MIFIFFVFTISSFLVFSPYQFHPRYFHCYFYVLVILLDWSLFSWFHAITFVYSFWKLSFIYLSILDLEFHTLWVEGLTQVLKISTGLLFSFLFLSSYSFSFTPKHLFNLRLKYVFLFALYRILHYSFIITLVISSLFI